MLGGAMTFAYGGWRLGRLAILLALCASFALRVSAQARGQAASPDRALLQSLAGQYMAGTITMTVTLLEDGSLTLYLPGQQLYHLLPETRFRYRMRELGPGYGVQFLRDVHGAVTGLTVRQPPPQQDFSAMRKPGQIVRAAPSPSGVAAPRVPQPVTPNVETRTTAPQPAAVPVAPRQSQAPAASTAATPPAPAAPRGAQAAAESAGGTHPAADRPSPSTQASASAPAASRQPAPAAPALPQSADTPFPRIGAVAIDAVDFVVALDRQNREGQDFNRDIAQAREAFWAQVPERSRANGGGDTIRRIIDVKGRAHRNTVCDVSSRRLRKPEHKRLRSPPRHAPS